jgi:hypothetical protein
MIWMMSYQAQFVSVVIRLCCGVQYTRKFIQPVLWCIWQVEPFIDTGSQSSCIVSEALASFSGFMDAHHSYCIFGLGEVRSATLGSALLCVKLSMGIEDTRMHQFAVVQGDTMPFCLILGADYPLASDVDLSFGDHTCLRNDKVIGNFQTSELLKCISVMSILGYMFMSSLPKSTTQVCIGTPTDHLSFRVERDDDGEISQLQSLISLDEIYNLQQQNSQLVRLRRLLVQEQPSGSWPGSLLRFRRYRNSLIVDQNVVLFRDKEGLNVAVVTFQFLIELVLVIHYEMAHIGRTKLLDIVTQHVWHPSVGKVVGDVTRSCHNCQTMKVAPIIQPPVHKVHRSAPFELLAVDLVALPDARGGMCGCIVAMDHHTKWLSAAPIRSKTTASVASVFEQRILPCLPKTPVEVLSDNGPEFIGEAFNEMLRSYGIRHIYTTPNRPSSNGLVERANRTLLELLRTQASGPSAWVDVLPRALIVHNTTYHRALEQSPSDYVLKTAHQVQSHPIVPFDLTDQWRAGHPSFGAFKVDQMVLNKTVFR